MLKPNNPYQVNIVVLAIIYNLSYSYYKGQKCEHFDTQQNITLSLFKQKWGRFGHFGDVLTKGGDVLTKSGGVLTKSGDVLVN